MELLRFDLDASRNRVFFGKEMLERWLAVCGLTLC